MRLVTSTTLHVATLKIAVLCNPCGPCVSMLVFLTEVVVFALTLMFASRLIMSPLSIVAYKISGRVLGFSMS